MRKSFRDKYLTAAKQQEPVANDAEGFDAYTNVAARQGFGTPSLAEATEYELVRWTNNYWLMITLYRNHWISRRIVDKPAQDMCKAWAVLNSGDLKPEDIDDFNRVLSRTFTKHRIQKATKFGRLFGGAGALMVIDGHEDMLDKPLDLDDVNPGSYKGLITFDRWSGITPDVEIVTDINSPIDFNLPKYYNVRGETAEQFRIHHSRILRFTGPEVPQPENQVQLHWGISELEVAYEEIRKRDNASWAILSLMFRAQILAQKNPKLAQMQAGVGASAQAMKQYLSTMQAQNELLSNNSMLLLGEDGELTSTSATFSGISEVYQQFQMDISGAARIPVSILFGRTATGLGQSNDSDIRIYEQEIAQKQQDELKPQLDKLYPVICMSTFGEVPDDLDFTFPSIRVLTEEEKTKVATDVTTAILAPYQAGLTSARLTLQELKASSETTGIFTNIDDEMINAADDQPVMPMMEGGEGESFGGEGADGFDEWNESDHPRDDMGRFGSGGGKSTEERTAEITRLKEKYSEILSTPLYSEGAIGPAQTARMSKDQFAKLQTKQQLKMELQSHFRSLTRTDVQIASAEAAQKAKVIASKRNQLNRQLQDIKDLGTMSHKPNGELKKGYQLAWNDATSKLAKLEAEESGTALDAMPANVGVIARMKKRLLGD